MAKSDDMLREIVERLETLTQTVDDRLNATNLVIDGLSRGLSALADTANTHSDMLAEIMEACSADAGPNPALHEALDRLAEAVEGQTETLTNIDQHLSALGQTVQQAVVRGVALATRNDIDQDGVIIDPSVPPDDYGFGPDDTGALT